MCGIAGVLDWRAPPADRLGAMLACIHHRGPDEDGIHAAGPLAMGMRRLSIIDLAGGRQPIAGEDGTVVTVFNGEIYNYVELRADLEARGHRFRTSTDTEVLVHLYEDEGTAFLPRLNGMFAFAIWDARRERLFLARDRLGVKPLYHATTPGGLAFASEAKSLLATGFVSRDLDPAALFDYLTCHYVPGERSAFRAIRKLLPGHWLLADRRGITIRRWWDLADHTAPTALTRDEARARVRELFLDSVRLRMRSDVPVGAYLSGGLDSSLVSVAAARETAIPLATFNVAFTPTEFDETPFARAVAQHAGTAHHEVRVRASDALGLLPRLVWHMDEPNGDSALLPTFLVSDLAARHVKVVLSGIGADELFGGYGRYHRRLWRFERLAMLPRPLLRALRPLLAALKHEWGPRTDRLVDPPPPWRDFLEKTHAFDESMVRRLLREPDRTLAERTRAFFARYRREDFVNQRMYVDAHTYLPDQILALTDRMSMAASIEARTPFLDYRLVELAASLPGDWKVHDGGWKIILKEALGDLVPPAILTRPKWGFASPVQSWTSARQLDALVALVRTSRLARAGWLDRAVLDRVVADPAVRAHDASWLWTLGVLEIWYRVYGEHSAAAAPAAALTDL